jgi:hypothetical protein
MTRPPVPPDHSALTGPDVITHGGWHPRYARVLAVSSDGDYGFAVVDGNGDGAEVEAELWEWDGGRWASVSSSGAGPLSTFGHLQGRGRYGSTCFAFGRAPGRGSVTISFDGHPHQVPVSHGGVWAFIKSSTDSCNCEIPVLIG